MLRFLRVLAVVALIGAQVRGQQPSLADVLSRLDAYLKQYEATMAAVVAEERYTQAVSLTPPLAAPVVIQQRELVSDYALARAPGGQTWTGYRDTFDVDGAAVRDREARLAGLLAAGTPESSAQARRIAAENARYNIGHEVTTRNINVPTVALDLVHPVNRSRFSFRRSAIESIDGVVTWRIDYAERSRPTFIRDPEGRDRRSRGAIWVAPSTGEVHKTALEWDGEPGGFITVTYGRDANVDALVPVRMVEQYQRDGATVDGEAIYTNYRRFQVTARVVQ